MTEPLSPRPQNSFATSFHARSVEDAFVAMSASRNGMSKAEALQRLSIHGKNALPEGKTEGLLSIFFKQFQGPLITVLLICALIVFVMGDSVDAIVILIVLIVNAIVGTFQEGKAQDRLSALKKFTETEAKVIREGREVIISDTEVVPGDIVVLQEGDKIPADCRLVFSNELSIDEAALTGESNPVRKHADQVFQTKTAVADQRNMVFRGTYVLSGLGQALVVATGSTTVIGRLAEKLSTIDAEVPLKASIRTLTNGIMIAMGIIITILFIAGINAGYQLSFMFKTVVAVAVSFVPEGLPVVVTLILATGVWRMSERNALVKKLQAVEALGQAKVIALDKTGTITKNQMMVATIYTGDTLYDVEGSGYEPTGTLTKRGSAEAIVSSEHPDILLLGKCAVLTAIASIAYSEEQAEWKRISGEPTEAALSVFGQKVGFNKDALELENPKRAEIPFSSKLKYHATVNEVNGKEVLFVASAPEAVVRGMNSLMRNGVPVPLTDDDRKSIEGMLQKMSGEGLRVLALAVDFSPPKNLNPEQLPQLTFIGFAGLTDVIRPEVYDAIRQANHAGVRVVMITGDYRETAKAIAEHIGLFKAGDVVTTGAELDTLSERELMERLPKTSVFARVTPEHKLKIIEAYRRRGDIIAMTGDGVNDALSLMAADLGVAMGKIGTEVAKEAADIILLDDNFGSIVAAIEEGRNIYHSIRKVVLYLLSTAAGEVLVISSAILLGLPLPLTPSQIIWLNLVTDGFLVVALALEPKSDGLLGMRFRTGKQLVNRLMLLRIVLLGAAMTAVTLFLFARFVDTDLVKASTIALTTLAVAQWFNAWNCRSASRSVFSKDFFSNRYLLGALGVVVVLQVSVVHVPFMQRIFSTTGLSLREWGLIIGVSLAVVAVEEIRKFASRFSMRHR